MNLVEIKNDQVVTTSLQVSENFKKRHDHVLRDIDGIKKDVPNFGEMFFEAIEQDSYNRDRRVIYMNRDGFSLLAMGFTGKKALSFKLQYIEQFNKMEEHIKSGKQNVPIDSETKRMNAEARLKNANSRLAKTFVEISKDATSEVNKALLQSKAVEVLTGEKLLDMPTLKAKLFDCDQIAKRLGVLSKSGKPHGTAVSQIIQKHIFVEENEYEIVPESVNGWSGSVVKYSESIISKVQNWLDKYGYPSVIQGASKNYHVLYNT